MVPFLVSQPYTLRRTELIWATVESYFRTYWYFVAGVPIAGIATIFLLHRTEMQMLGGLMVLWPITTPARAALITLKTWKKLGVETRARVGENELFIEAEGQTPVRVPYTWLRRVMKIGALYVLQGTRGAFTVIRATAFSLEDRAEIEGLFRTKGFLHP
jgi:hypothetical protein